ncbi:MAG: hypothetical protein QXU54_02085, partial [Candidatus Micrarchaeia archaeon]
LLIYLIGARLLDEKRALLAVAVFLASLPALLYGGRVITDPLTLLFTLISLYGVLMHEKTPKSIIPLLLIGAGIFGASLSKSISSGILTVVFALALAYFEKVPLKRAVIASGISIIIATISLNGQFIVTEIYRVAPLMSDDWILKTLSNLVLLLLYLGPLSVFLWLFFTKILNERSFGFIDFWAISIFSLLAVKIIAVLPWYLIYFLPGVSLLIARQATSKFDTLVVCAIILASGLTSMLMLLSILDKNDMDMAEISEYIPTLGERKILIISRLGEVIANKAYVLKNAALVFPENGIFIREPNDGMHYMGVRKEVATEHNIRGLIYDYGNETYLPKFIDMMNDSERYYPPIGRTQANFTGPFEIIVAEDVYASIIEKIAPEYEAIYTTKNSMYKVFRLKESGGIGKE